MTIQEKTIGQKIEAGHKVMIPWECRAFGSKGGRTFTIEMRYGARSLTAMTKKIRETFGGDWAVIDASEISV